MTEPNKTPDTTTPSFATIPELIEQTFSRYGDAPAYTCMGHTLSYAEVKRLSVRFASFLQHHTDLEPGDRLAFQLPNILQYPVLLYGAAMAGIVLVNTNPLYTATELKHQLKDSGAKGLIVLANVADKAAEVLGETDVTTVIITEVGDLLPWPKRLLVNAVLRYIKKMVPKYQFAESISLLDALNKGTQAVKKVQVKPEQVFMLQYTGGTTGVAKGAMLSHKNLCSNVWQVMHHLPVLFTEPSEQACAALPLYHIFAFNMHALCVFSKGGHNLLIPNPRDLRAFVKALKGSQISLMIAVNTLYNSLCRDSEFIKLDFSKLKISAAGGMAVTEDVARQWFELTNNELCEGYGLTETSPVLISNPESATRRGTIGVPLIDTEIQLVDDAGVPVAEGEPGEVWARGPQVMLGYWQRPEATAQTMADGGWFKTGDIGVKLPNGYYKIVDRKKDMISVSGFKVFPNEVEDVTTLHPGIIEAAVVGVPAETVGEHVKLYVVVSDKTLTADDIKEHCRKHLTGYKVPKLIEFRDELPKSNVGKILRKDLRDQPAEGGSA